MVFSRTTTSTLPTGFPTARTCWSIASRKTTTSGSRTCCRGRVSSGSSGWSFRQGRPCSIAILLPATTTVTRRSRRSTAATISSMSLGPTPFGLLRMMVFM
ncbi:hypothetical protein LINGRAHAP2_LOCUS9054 [Linum grandiflorum]